MAFDNKEFDVLVIGGGINGVGIARDAAGRGLKVMLCEKGDLACATSSASSKLIHGGLRYLEQGEFRLVREALSEREVLLRNAPHLISPLGFCLPHQANLRSSWLIRLGLFLYDHLSKCVTLPSSKAINLSSSLDLKASITQGFLYSDAWVDDSRLTVLNAVSAHDLGASIYTRHKVVSIKAMQGVWQVDIVNRSTEKQHRVTAKAVVNAAGPWVNKVNQCTIDVAPTHVVRLVKGSHIVVPKFLNHDYAYILQNSDKRIVFVLPFEDDFTLIGTTDLDFQDNLEHVCISDDEVNYLLSAVNHYFEQQISAADMIHSFSGVRPLLSDGANTPQKITRDYTFELLSSTGKAPYISIYGGKITTYRKLSESVVDKLMAFFPQATKSWTAYSPLPGGDFSDRALLLKTLQRQFPSLPNALLKRYVRSYGSLAVQVLCGVTEISDLGEHFGGDLYQVEVDYLVQREWAKNAEDILWRRTKQGLRLDKGQVLRLAQYMRQCS